MRDDSNAGQMALALLLALAAWGIASPTLAQPQTDYVNANATLETFLNREQPELDAIGDPLPRRAVMRFGTERFQHPSSVIAMELSPDEATLITLNSEAIIAWDTVTGAELWRRDWRDYGQHIIGPAYGQRFLTFAGNSSQFFTPGTNNQVHAWSTRSGQVESIQLTDQAGILQLFGAPRIASFTSVDLSPDGDFLLAGNSVGVSQYTLQGKRQWNLENKPDVPLELGGDNRDRLSFAGDYSTGIYSPDGKLVAVHRSQYPNRISLVSSESGKIVSGIATRDIVVRMTFSPDGSSLFTTERDCGIRRYSLQDQNLTWELVVPPDEKGAE
ncbi:MAG: WD40 repeat domain-containing protein, partial [bacterium]|nr:WD40 repeat domain-containing protein [bacterium]